MADESLDDTLRDLLKVMGTKNYFPPPPAKYRMRWRWGFWKVQKCVWQWENEKSYIHKDEAIAHLVRRKLEGYEVEL